MAEEKKGIAVRVYTQLSDSGETQLIIATHADAVSMLKCNGEGKEYDGISSVHVLGACPLLVQSTTSTIVRLPTS